MSTINLKASSEKFIFYCVAASITLRIILGNRTLDYLYLYNSDEGNPLLKIHPGTWLLFSTFIFYSLGCGLSKVASDLIFRKKILAFSLAITFFTILYSVAMWGFGGGATFVDTYLYSIICLILVSELRDKYCSRLYLLTVTLVMANCFIAFFEFLTQSYLMPNPATAGGFFRANALMDHPLNNALITTAVFLTFFISPYPLKWRFIVSFIGFLALLTFATRAALLMYTLAIILLITTRSLNTRIKKSKSYLIFLPPAIAILAIAAFYYLIFFTSIGSGISTRAEFDDSGFSRIYAVLFFTKLPIEEYFFGVGVNDFYTLVAQYSHYTIIENFWIQLILILGIPAFSLMTIAYGSIYRWALKNTSFPGLIVGVTWIITASTNNSLSVKTPALMTFLLSAYLLSRSQVAKN